MAQSKQLVGYNGSNLMTAANSIYYPTEHNVSLLTGPSVSGIRNDNALNIYPDGRSALNREKSNTFATNFGKQIFKGESKIEYVPYEKKIVEYKDHARVERVPKKVKKIDYREERKVETIPREVVVTDYYAIEYIREYIPQFFNVRATEYVKVAKKQLRYQYLPVERQILHYPDQSINHNVLAVSAVSSTPEYVKIAKKQLRYEYVPVQKHIIHYPVQQVDVNKISHLHAGSTVNELSLSAVNGQVVSTVSGQAVNGQVLSSRNIITTTNQQQVYGQTYAAVPENNYAYSAGPYRTTYEYQNLNLPVSGYGYATSPLNH